MQRITLLALLLSLPTVLSACGGGPSQPEATVQPSQIGAPALTPTLVGLPASPALPTATAEGPAPSPVADASSVAVTVTLADNTISASQTTFTVGTKYTFVISNQGRHEHNFVISPPVSVAGGYAQALAQALMAVDQTQLPPGDTVSVDFTFPASAAGANLEFNCLIPRHYESGMRLAITVAH